MGLRRLACAARCRQASRGLIQLHRLDGAWRWIGSRNPEGGVPWPLRRALQTNEEFARDYYRPTRLARQFPTGTSSMPKVNGIIGIDDPDFDLAQFRLDRPALRVNRDAHGRW